MRSRVVEGIDVDDSTVGQLGMAVWTCNCLEISRVTEAVVIDARILVIKLVTPADCRAMSGSE